MFGLLRVQSLRCECIALQARLLLSAGEVCQSRWYSSRNPLERRSMAVLQLAASGRDGGRKGKGRKRGQKKSMALEEIKLGRGGGGIRWPGLSLPIPNTPYGPRALRGRNLAMQKVEEVEKSDEESSDGYKDSVDEDEEKIGVVDPKFLKDHVRVEKSIADQNWTKRGWTGRSWPGRYVGCPLSPDGTPLTAFRSLVVELKRVTQQTTGGRKRSVSALVVVGNGRGAGGFALGRADDLISAIKKAKNKAVNRLQFVPMCENHTVYHDVQAKCTRTTIVMERKVKGFGLRCHRAVIDICKLVGIKDLRAKIYGSTNPRNIVRATFKAFSMQETPQQLADRKNKLVVEYKNECLLRPVVVAVPKTFTPSELDLLKSMQMVSPEVVAAAQP